MRTFGFIPFYNRGNNKRDAAIVIRLFQNHFVNELSVESRRIHVETGSSAERLGVTCPAKAFVSLRTIGRYIEEIAALPPECVQEKPIQEGIGSLNGAGNSQIGMDDHAAEIFWIGCSGISGKAEIAEAVECKVGTNPTIIRTGGSEGVECFCLAQIVAEEVSVRIENFAGLQRPRSTGRHAVANFEPSGHFLSEV